MGRGGNDVEFTFDLESKYMPSKILVKTHTHTHGFTHKSQFCYQKDQNTVTMKNEKHLWKFYGVWS